ncbi:MAG: NAD(P)/FAD-dependent oxidoreductase [Micavibrio sp.]|nr:NAD(P)/FAD-dependent oxidoreductase [Micavibrio sp.]
MRDLQYDAVIIGAGAAGLMCAIEAGKRGRTVWLVDHTKKTAEKIRISGGGRCNFTNIGTSPANFISQNPHFCKSALKQYTQTDFIAMVEKHGIKWHEKKLGQLFCDNSAQEIIDMLVNEAKSAGVRLDMETNVETIKYKDGSYHIVTDKGAATCTSFVVACGGLSIPKIGASPMGYKIAKQFGLEVIDPEPALVPLTFSGALLDQCKSLSGVSVDALVSFEKNAFREGLLFTHRGLSGPSILQISSYWQEGQPLKINLAPDLDVLSHLKSARHGKAKQDISTILSGFLPARLVESILEEFAVAGRIADLSDKKLQTLATRINDWKILPAGTEGYRTAEVTRGGVDTDALSSKTMEAKTQKGLYFIGEVVDVTGHLGGYNFQWAWSSGYVAGQHI